MRDYDCKCSVKTGENWYELTFCPLHDAAPQMREALRKALQSLENVGGFLEDKYGPAPLLTEIRAALKAADGEGE